VILNLNRKEIAMEHRSVLENSNHLSICSNAEFPSESETEDGPSELCVRE
jgi:hypothetical protein